jgi:hypothetical protein
MPHLSTFELRKQACRRGKSDLVFRPKPLERTASHFGERPAFPSPGIVRKIIAEWLKKKKPKGSAKK